MAASVETVISAAAPSATASRGQRDGPDLGRCTMTPAFIEKQFARRCTARGMSVAVDTGFVKKLLHVALGIVTSFGGFLEAGSIATSIQAGAEYGYSLLWVLLLGTICLIALIEMSGRLA